MGKVIALPVAERRVGNPDLGCVHAWQTEDGAFEIGHESRSGESWGGFERFDHPELAVAAAHSLARSYGGCEVSIRRGVLDAFGSYVVGPDIPPFNRGEF